MKIKNNLLKTVFIMQLTLTLSGCFFYMTDNLSKLREKREYVKEYTDIFSYEKKLFIEYTTIKRKKDVYHHIILDIDDIIHSKKPLYCIMRKSELPLKVKEEGEGQFLINATSCAPFYGQTLRTSKLHFEPKFELFDRNQEETIIKKLPCQFTYKNRLAYPFVIIGTPITVVGDIILSPFYIILIYCALSDFRAF